MLIKYTQPKIRSVFFLLTIIILFLLTACQTQNTVKTSATELSKWQELELLALQSLKAKDYAQAQQFISELINVAGTDLKKWNYIRMAMVSLPYENARPLLGKAFSIPKINQSAELLFGFSQVYAHYRMNQKSLKTVTKAIEINKQAKFILWRARLYLLLEEFILSEQDYNYLIEHYPADKQYVSQYASLLQHQKLYDKAQQVLSTEPENKEFLYKSVVFALQSDDRNQAKSSFKKLKTTPNTKPMTDQQLYNVGEPAYWLDDYQYSIELMEQVKSGERINDARTVLARALIEVKQTERAVVLLKQVQNASAELATVAFLLESSIYMDSKEYQEAESVLNLAIGLFKDNHELLYSRAMLFEVQDKIILMEQDLRVIIDNDPDSYDALNALGYSLVDRGLRLDESFDYIKKAYDLAPDNHAIQDSMGWAYYKKGDLENAEKYLRMAIEGNARDSESYHHLLEVLKQGNKNDKYKKLLEQAQSLFPEEVF
ncbi:MAG: hypothetical protein L3J52_02610 [Proteobacteria bacterium]|nr:hypothetical protein [Pseudomonadota bacterium]